MTDLNNRNSRTPGARRPRWASLPAARRGRKQAPAAAVHAAQASLRRPIRIWRSWGAGGTLPTPKRSLCGAGAHNGRAGSWTMGLILIIIVLFLLFGGGGGYYAHRRFGMPGLGGVVGLILIVLVVLWLFGGLHLGHL